MNEKKYIKREIYWHVYFNLLIFYLQTGDIIFDIFSGTIEKYINTLTLITAAFLLGNTTYFLKHQDYFLTENPNNLKKSILPWIYCMCGVMIYIWFLKYIYCFTDMIMTISVMIALAINTLFLSFALVGKFENSEH